MFEIILYQPEIPPNTGNVIRLAANAGCRLHLVAPLGFRLDERSLRRSGMDYREVADVVVHEDWDTCREALRDHRMFALSTRGATRHDEVQFAPGDALLFGPETRGLPSHILESFGPREILRIPLRAGNRSLNLSNAVAVVVYEGWRQRGFG